MADVAEVSTKLYGEIYRFLRRRTGSNAVAEDLTQQVFLEAAASKTWQSGKGNLGLLFTIARRRLVDELRKPERSYVPLEDAEHLASAPAEVPQYTRAVISAAIDGLDPEQREVVILKLLRGLSFTEVAHHVGATEGACKMRLRRGLENLRSELELKGIRP
jgi:RNA polymerase sigma-70 factor (ECF subfamily)